MSRKNGNISLTPEETLKVREVLERMREIQSDTGHGKISIVISHRKIRYIEIIKTIKDEKNDSG